MNMLHTLVVALRFALDAGVRQNLLHQFTMESTAMKTILVSMAVLLAAALGSDAVFAKTVSIAGNSKTKVEGRCNESGGVFWTQGSTGHTYGCMNSDGGGIVCSGVTSAQKKTC